MLKELQINRETLLSKIILVASILTLFLIVFLPIGSDQSIFLRAAQVMLHGGTLYKDYIDIKPPLIYYLYLIPASLPINSVIAVRIFDILYQAVFLILFYKVMMRLTKESLISAITTFLYAVFYVVQEFPNLGEGETFTNLPLLLILSVLISKDQLRFRGLFFIGVCVGFVTLIKYDLAIMLVPIFIMIITTRISGILKSFLGILLGFLLAVAIIFLPILLNTESFNGFLNTLAFLKSYGDWNIFQLNRLIDGLKQISYFLGDNVSITLIALSTFGILHLFKERDNRIIKVAGGFSVLMICSMLITIMLENKFMAYHFQRLQSYLFILIGLGLFAIKDDITRTFKSRDRLNRVLVFAMVCLAVAFSPMPRYFYLIYKASSYAVNPEKAYYHYEIGHNSNEKFVQDKEIADYINPRNKSNDKVLLISTGMDNLSTFIETDNQWRMPHSVFYFSSWAPKQWKSYFNQDFKQATWIIIAKNDIFPILKFYKSSFKYLMNDCLTSEDLQTNCAKVFETADFIVYQRNNR